MAGVCARQRKLPSSMLCRGNCDEEETNNDSVNSEGLLAEPPPDFDRSLLPVAAQPETNIVSGGERQLPSASLCRQDCEETELIEVADPDRLSAAGYGRSQLPVAVQPEPDTVSDSAGEKPTDTDAMAGEEDYPEKTEFVVHVQQDTDNPPPSPPAQAHHHHHHPESGSTSSGSGGSRRRHHRLPCWDYEKRERQCLNGGQCFAIQLHNGIRRSGCRLVTY